MYYTQEQLDRANQADLVSFLQLQGEQLIRAGNEYQMCIRDRGKPQTIGEMLAEARQKSGAQKLAGHDIMALERFDPDTRHMIVFAVLSNDSPMGWKGEKMRLFLTEAGYGKALENQEKGFIRIRNHCLLYTSRCV